MAGLSPMTADLRRMVRGELRPDEPLGRHTTFQVGGPADLLFVPADAGDLVRGVQWAAAAGWPVMYLGAGSNLLVRDEGVRGLVVLTTKALRHIAGDASGITAGAGTRLLEVVRLAMRLGLTGSEFMAGIPGTVGGAVVMNAGALGGDVAGCLEWARLLDAAGERTAGLADLGYGYRVSALLGGATLVLEARFRLGLAGPRVVRDRVRAVMSRRRRTQPLGQPSAGSVFKNPAPDKPAGVLIDRAGCRGLRSGQALVSPRHANFIVNLGGATAADVLRLIDIVRDRVAHQFGVRLDLEVRVVGG